MLFLEKQKRINEKLAKKLQLKSCLDDANLKTLIEANKKLKLMLQLRRFERPFSRLQFKITINKTIITIF